MKSSILLHGGTKNLTSATAKYKINDDQMIDRIVQTYMYGDYRILIWALRNMWIRSSNSHLSISSPQKI